MKVVGAGVAIRPAIVAPFFDFVFVFVFGQHVVQLLVYSMAFALSGRVNYELRSTFHVRRSTLLVRHFLAMAKNVN